MRPHSLHAIRSAAISVLPDGQILELRLRIFGFLTRVALGGRRLGGPRAGGLGGLLRFGGVFSFMLSTLRQAVTGRRQRTGVFVRRRNPGLMGRCRLDT